MKNRFVMMIAALSVSVCLQAQGGADEVAIINTPHISAPEGAFAKTVLMPGDPLRAKFIAETFLDDARLVTSVRNMLGYTGSYKGVPVSVMGSGMGMPSIGIYSWELYTMFGVENIIRIGSAGSYKQGLEVLDVALAESSTAESTYALMHNGETERTLLPSQSLNAAIQKKAGELGIGLKMSKVHTTDVFYSQEAWQDIAERTGTDCVEMESFALFHNAAALGKRAACLLTISDSYVNKRELSAEEREHSMTEMIRLALETAVSNSVTGVAEAKAGGTEANDGKYLEKNRIVVHKNGKRYNLEGIRME